MKEFAVTRMQEKECASSIEVRQKMLSLSTMIWKKVQFQKATRTTCDTLWRYCSQHKKCYTRMEENDIHIMRAYDRYCYLPHAVDEGQRISIINA
jgi:hypothetical protein